MGAAVDLAQAQTYPARPITLVIPFPPGGSTSIVSRVIADKMGELLGEKIVIDNRAGAGGTVGTRAVAKSDPDGYTLGLGYTGTLANGPSLYKNLGYDPRKDFAPIGMIGNAPNSLVVHPSFPAKSLTELVAHAKANPGKVNFGSAGAGTVAARARAHRCGRQPRNPGTDARGLKERSFRGGSGHVTCRPDPRRSVRSACDWRRRSGFEMNPDPRLLSPDDAAQQMAVVGFDHQREALRNADRRAHLECGAGFGKIADRAVDAAPPPNEILPPSTAAAVVLFCARPPRTSA